MHINKAALSNADPGAHADTSSCSAAGADRNFYHSSFVFQVAISSYCCCSANQKSRTPMRVIISPSGKNKSILVLCGYRDVCVYVISALIEFIALSHKNTKLDIFQHLHTEGSKIYCKMRFLS